MRLMVLASNKSVLYSTETDMPRTDWEMLKVKSNVEVPMST